MATSEKNVIPPAPLGPESMGDEPAPRRSRRAERVAGGWGGSPAQPASVNGNGKGARRSVVARDGAAAPTGAKPPAPPPAPITVSAPRTDPPARPAPAPRLVSAAPPPAPTIASTVARPDAAEIRRRPQRVKERPGEREAEMATTTRERPALARAGLQEWPELDGANSLFRGLEQVVLERVLRARDWYRTRSRAPRLAYRASGTLVLVVAVAMPLVAALAIPERNVLLSIMAVLIAAATALSAFFSWERTWRSRRQAEIALDRLITAYELRMLEIRARADDATMLQESLGATRKLMQDAAAITAAEAEDFFRGVRWPQHTSRM